MLTLKSLATQALTGDGGNSLSAGGNTGLGADSAGGGVNATTPHIGLIGKHCFFNPILNCFPLGRVLFYCVGHTALY